jgi:hypothetical protein
MATNYKFKTDSGSVIDLTSTSVNPGAAPTSTPRQGGFSLRNRVNFGNVSAANSLLTTLASTSAASQTANLMYFLQVPNRTLVKKVHVFGVKSQTAPATSVSLTASGLNASHLASAVFGINAAIWSKPDSTTRVAASHLDKQTTAVNSLLAGALFGQIPLQKAGASVAFEASLVEKVDASMTAPRLGQVQTTEAAGGGAVVAGLDQGVYFPFGGYVYGALGPYNVGTGNASVSSASKANSDTISLAGVWEMQADCMYVPE